MFDFGSLVGIGASAATGNYAGAALSAVGLGISMFGGSEQSRIAKEQAEVSADIARQEKGINAEKQKAMEISGRRTQLEIMRNTQRARALAENTATAQGAQFGSGLQGGLAQVQNQGLFNLTGVNSSLTIGRAIAGYNDAISDDKIKLASLGGDASEAQGYQSLGGSIIKAGPTFGNLMSGFGGSSSNRSGNYSGTPGASNTGGLY